MGKWVPKNQLGFTMGFWSASTNFGYTLAINIRYLMLDILDFEWEIYLLTAGFFMFIIGIYNIYFI